MSKKITVLIVEEEAIVGSKIILLQDQLKSMKSVKHIAWKYKGSNTKLQAGTRAYIVDH